MLENFSKENICPARVVMEKDKKNRCHTCVSNGMPALMSLTNVLGFICPKNVNAHAKHIS